MPPPSSRSASPAADIAAALGARAEAVCRRYLPQGRKQGRYWVAGDLQGARGRSLFVRLHGPGVPGKWTDAATGEHGDLLDLVRHRSGAPTLRAALAEARAFLARDNDSEGERAAQRLARRCARAGVAAHVIVSEYGDFNDDLVTLGPRALALRLAALHGKPLACWCAPLPCHGQVLARAAAWAASVLAERRGE